MTRKLSAGSPGQESEMSAATPESATTGPNGQGSIYPLPLTILWSIKNIKGRRVLLPELCEEPNRTWWGCEMVQVGGHMLKCFSFSPSLSKKYPCTQKTSMLERRLSLNFSP
ncbi:Hypothetical predicted protein [Podarcis lilfordi]|uniref:Uncharacterized protein n=1 Tax=Podarcis lilfordi TaxID=74358 RepID=A0AA35LAJ2_9SAUR|nr:Hypothetical predicted protein [Podarcis lilfordi]